MKEEHLKNYCMDSLHILSPRRISAIICVCGVLEVLWKKVEENGLYTAFGWLKQQKLVKAAGTAMFYLVCLGQTFSSCSLTVYLQVCCL